MRIDRRILNSGALVPMVAVLSNPESTINAAGMSGVRSVLRSASNVVHYELSTLDDIDEALALFGRANPSLLVINGGDGTVGQVLAALLYRNPFTVTPPIAILPGGQTNLAALDLGYRGRQEKVLKKLLRIVRNGKVTDRLVLKHLIELDLGDGTPPRVGTFFGGTSIVKGLMWCRRHGYRPGRSNQWAHFKVFLSLIPEFMGLKRSTGTLAPSSIYLKARGRADISGDFSMLIVSTLDRLIFRMKPFGTVGQGSLQYSLIEPGGKSLRRALWGQLTGAFGRGKLEAVHVGRSDAVDIIPGGPVTLDGEIYDIEEGRKLSLKGNRSLTFVKL